MAEQVLRRPDVVGCLGRWQRDKGKDGTECNSLLDFKERSREICSDCRTIPFEMATFLFHPKALGVFAGREDLVSGAVLPGPASEYEVPGVLGAEHLVWLVINRRL